MGNQGIPSLAPFSSASIAHLPFDPVMTTTHLLKFREVLLVFNMCGHSVVSGSLQCYRQQPSRPFCSWDSPGKNTGVGCHFFLQGIFPTQGSTPCLLCLLHWQADSLPPNHQGAGSQVSSSLRSRWSEFLQAEIHSGKFKKE